MNKISALFLFVFITLSLQGLLPQLHDSGDCRLICVKIFFISANFSSILCFGSSSETIISATLRIFSGFVDIQSEI